MTPAPKAEKTMPEVTPSPPQPKRRAKTPAPAPDPAESELERLRKATRDRVSARDVEFWNFMGSSSLFLTFQFRLVPKSLCKQMLAALAGE